MSKRFTVQEAIAPYTKAIIANANIEYAPCRAIMVNKAYVADDSTSTTATSVANSGTTAFTDTDGDGSVDVSGTGTVTTTGTGTGTITTATSESANNITSPQLWFTDNWKRGATDEKITLAATLICDGTIYPFSVKMHDSGTNTLIFLY